MKVRLAAYASLLLACPADVGKHPPKDKQAPAPAEQDAKQDDAKVAAKPEPEAEPEAEPEPDAKPTAAKLLPDAPLPITDILGKPPPEAQAKLGEPTGKGMTRTSCVRFVPDRVWFECSYAHQRYADTTGTYTAVQVSYEDGKAAAVAFEGVPGEGAFDPVAALAKVGLVLPAAPRVSEPKEGVELWSWFNHDARLVLDGKQYRVEVSTVDDKWSNSKVEVILNHPLDETQQSKIKPPREKAG
jgi:hypothetical protein